MSDKSYVTLEQHVCPVCGKTFDTNALLLDRTLRKTFERHTVTGSSLCPEHKKQSDEGYIHLVGIDEAASSLPLTPETAYRTGVIAAIRRSAWNKVFNVPEPTTPLCYVPNAVIELLQSKIANG